jgi:hypothetical protein
MASTTQGSIAMSNHYDVYLPRGWSAYMADRFVFAAIRAKEFATGCVWFDSYDVLLAVYDYDYMDQINYGATTNELWVSEAIKRLLASGRLVESDVEGIVGRNRVQVESSIWY